MRIGGGLCAVFLEPNRAWSSLQMNVSGQQNLYTPPRRKPPKRSSLENCVARKLFNNRGSWPSRLFSINVLVPAEVAETGTLNIFSFAGDFAKVSVGDLLTPVKVSP